MESNFIEEVSRDYLMPGLIAYVLGTCECNYCKMIKAIKGNEAEKEENKSS